MPLFKRFDGDHVRDVPPTRAIMPYIMPQRVHAQVLFEQELDVTNVLADLERRNAGGGPKITLFQVYVHAAARTLAERPRLNRFTMGPHLYQRKQIEIGFSAKKAMRRQKTSSVSVEPTGSNAAFATGSGLRRRLPL